MENQEHIEQHFTGNYLIRNVILGISDGLTVPFALAAGLAGANTSSQIIVIAGLAEIAAGSISMGLGAYLAAKNEIEHYKNEKAREYDEVKNLPEKEKEEVIEILINHGLNREQTLPIISAFEKNPDAWVDFMMRFELNMEEPDPKLAGKNSAAMAAAYIAGGIMPLMPYFFIDIPLLALRYSIILTIITLMVFGYTKAKIIGSRPFKGIIQTTTIGMLAAGAAYFIANLFTK